MSDWMSSEITLGLGSIALGTLVGRLCAWVACWLPALREHQWQCDAREMLGLDLHKHSAPQLPRASRAEIWIVQIGCAGLSLMVTLHFGPTRQALFALPFTWGLLTLSLIDRQHHLLPDVLVMPGLWVGLVLNSFGVFTTLQEALWGCVIGYLAFWTVYQLVKLITGKESIGSGDFKLLALIGAWSGWQVIPCIVAGSLMIAVILAVYLRLVEDRAKSENMPFGPSLSLAGWAVFLTSANSFY